MFAVLAEAFGRFHTSAEITELAFSDAPDCDQPESKSTTAAIRLLETNLVASGYQIERSAKHGYRLIDDETVRRAKAKLVRPIKRQHVNRLAQSLEIAKTKAEQDRRYMSPASKPRPKKKLTKIQRLVSDRIRAEKRKQYKLQKRKGKKRGS